jgi:hypothetical protein
MKFRPAMAQTIGLSIAAAMPIREPCPWPKQLYEDRSKSRIEASTAITMDAMIAPRAPLEPAALRLGC